LYPYQGGIADAIADPTIERVTVQKCVRVGFTTMLVGGIASFVADDPTNVLVLMPTEDDARGLVVDEIEPIFTSTPAVAGTLAAGVDETAARNTLAHRRFAGGSLKVVAAKAPRNLRRHTARVLMVDECDAMEPTAEGSPVTLAERRTLSYPDRRIIVGLTPLDEATSTIVRLYAQSDMRVYECPCPACGAFTEMLWRHLEWEPQKPETAAFRCPACQALVGEEQKPGMVAAGRWRATRPEIVGHAGFRLNALISPLANARWRKLAAEFLRAKDDTDELRTFVNTILGEPWRDAGVEVDESALAARAEPFSLEAIPADVLVITVGVDLQDDRLECSVIGWSRTETFVLAHLIVWGSPGEDSTWHEVDEVLKTKWTHPAGGRIGVDACVIDSGHMTDRVYAFAFPRAGRRIFPGKGLAASRPIVEPSRSKIRGGRLLLCGVDTIKSTIYDALARGRRIRFSDTLQPAYFEQVTSERRVTRYSRGVPVRRFERKPGAAAEALDCLCYGWAARAVVVLDLDRRSTELAEVLAPPTAPTAVPSPWVSAW
jgi:phage terminase large subunit GpA-like protein